MSRFWAKILINLYLYCGFYFLIRSGNWVLRNSFLKALAPLFAYGRRKYEALFVSNVYDTLTIPAEILKRFMDGEWTVSLKGFHFSNLALDEAHEYLAGYTRTSNMTETSMHGIKDGHKVRKSKIGSL